MYTAGSDSVPDYGTLERGGHAVAPAVMPGQAGTPLAGRCLAQLDALRARSEAFTFASLALVDGRVMCCSAANEGLQAARIAALSSSLLALAESFSREASLGGTRYTTVSSQDGNIVLVWVPSQARRHVLAVASDPGQNLAICLRWTLDTAARLAAILDAEPAAPVVNDQAVPT